MRGNDQQNTTMFSYISPEERVPADHPLRPIRSMVDQALNGMSPLFETLYSHTGRPGIPPERLLRALLLQVLYTVRSERMLMEQLDYNLLFRWFVGLNMDDPIWDVTVFTKNRDRLLEGDVAGAFFQQVLSQARNKALLSDEHFTVDGTLIEAWAGNKSFKPKEDPGPPPPDDPGHPSADFRGKKRSNETHRSTSDPDARFYKKAKGQTARLSYMGHVLMENRNALAVSGRLTRATGTAEVESSVEMAQAIPGHRRATLGADKYYDTKAHVGSLRGLNITPHVAQHDTNRRSAVDGRTVRHPGYAISMQKRKRVEEIFGWLKTVGMIRKTRHRGIEKVGWIFMFSLAAYNLVRMRNLAPEV